MAGGPFGFLALVDLMSREIVLFEEVELLPDDIMVPTGVSVEVVLLDFIVFEHQLHDVVLMFILQESLELGRYHQQMVFLCANESYGDVKNLTSVGE